MDYEYVDMFWFPASSSVGSVFPLCLPGQQWLRWLSGPFSVEEVQLKAW